MTRVLGDCRADLRDRLDETQARFWSDAQLNRWINEGAMDVSRRGECLPTSSVIAVVAGTRDYALPTNGFTLHRAEYTPDSGQTVYPLELRDINEMDEIWSTRQLTQQYAPAYLTLLGYPPNWQARLFPVPSQAGSLTVYLFRAASPAQSDTDDVDLPAGWEDLAILYASYVALRKDSNPQYQEAKTEYEEKLGTLIDTTRRFHDQGGYVVSATNFQPGWLVSGDGWGW